MAFDTIEESVKTGQRLVSREGWLGWVLVAATFLLAFYVWDSHQQSMQLRELLVSSQEIQRDSLQERREKTDAINQLVEANRNLAERSKIASENLQQLVTLVTVGYRIDEQRTTTILEQLKHVASASELSAEEIRKLRMLFKSPAGDISPRGTRP